MSGDGSGKRRRALLAAAGLAGIALAAAAFLPLGGPGAGRRDVPTWVVRAAPFVHRIPAEGNLRAANATVVAVPAGVPGPFRIAWLAPDGSRVRAGEMVVRFDPTDLEKGLRDAEDDLAGAGFKEVKERVESAAEVGKLDRDAALARSELADADRFQKKDETIYSRHERIESDIDRELARERERQARQARGTRQRLAGTELDLLAIEQRKARLKIERARAGLAAIGVRAPHDGILVLKRNWRGELPRVGETVWNGQPLAEIPDLGRMEAEVYVLEADAGGLEPGLRAMVTLESRPGASVAARVARVDALAKPRLRGSPVQYFAVTLALARTDPAAMKPGQRVRAWLVLDERPRALAVPRQAVFEREGRSVVFRRAARGDGFAPVAVELGPAGMGRRVIESGLAPGDVIALADPEASPAAAAGSPGARAGCAPAAAPLPAPRP